MAHKLTSYVPKLDEFVLLRQAFTEIVCQVTALNHQKAEVVYLVPDGDGTREIRKWVEFKRLIPYSVPEAVEK